RRKAADALVALGGRALPALRKAAADHDAEIRRLAESCVRRIGRAPPPALVRAAAGVVAARKPPAAAAVLLDSLPGVADPDAAAAVRAALAAVATRAGRVDPAVVRA